MTSLMNNYEAGEEGFENRKEEFFHMAGSLVEMAGMYGFSGNLWHTYLTQLLVNHEKDVYKRQVTARILEVKEEAQLIAAALEEYEG